jgi:hypothetical protein
MAARKNPVRQASMIGVDTMLLLLLKQLSRFRMLCAGSAALEIRGVPWTARMQSWVWMWITLPV